MSAQPARGQNGSIRHHDLARPADAVDPASFGLPSVEPVEGPSEGRARYSPDLVMNWVWAFSFARGRPVLVPDRRTGLMPRWADLRLFTSVHRDRGGHGNHAGVEHVMTFDPFAQQGT